MRLTDREREVAALVALGLSNKLIAVELGLADHTVKFHVKNLCRKYGTTSRVVVAVQYAVDRALRPCEAGDVL